MLNYQRVKLNGPGANFRSRLPLSPRISNRFRRTKIWPFRRNCGRWPPEKSWPWITSARLQWSTPVGSFSKSLWLNHAVKRLNFPNHGISTGLFTASFSEMRILSQHRSGPGGSKKERHQPLGKLSIFSWCIETYDCLKLGVYPRNYKWSVK